MGDEGKAGSFPAWTDGFAVRVVRSLSWLFKKDLKPRACGGTVTNCDLFGVFWSRFADDLCQRSGTLLRSGRPVGDVCQFDKPLPRWGTAMVVGTKAKPLVTQLAGGFALSVVRSPQRSHLKITELGFGSALYGARDSRGAMTATEYIFATAMTVLIIWLVAEVSVTSALKGPRSAQRRGASKHRK